MRVQGASVPVGASIGAAHGKGIVADLFERADAAMYAAKGDGRGQVRWGKPD